MNSGKQESRNFLVPAFFSARKDFSWTLDYVRGGCMDGYEVLSGEIPIAKDLAVMEVTGQVLGDLLLKSNQ